MRRWASALLVLFSLASCSGSRGTIGAVLAQDASGRLFVRDVPGGLAAERAGLEVGDEILLIDGLDPRAMSPRAVHEALAGEVGDPVKLTLIRAGKVVRVTLKRTPPRKYPVSGG